MDEGIKEFIQEKFQAMVSMVMQVNTISQERWRKVEKMQNEFKELKDQLVVVKGQREKCVNKRPSYVTAEIEEVANLDSHGGSVALNSDGSKLTNANVKREDIIPVSVNGGGGSSLNHSTAECSKEKTDIAISGREVARMEVAIYSGDNRHEHGSCQTEMTKLKQELTELKAQFDHENEKKKSFLNTLNVTAARVKKIERSMPELTRENSVTEQLATVNANLEAIRSKSEQNSANIVRVEETVNKLESELESAKITNQTSRLENSRESVEIKEKFDNINVCVQKLDDRITSTDQLVETLYESCDEILSKIQEGAPHLFNEIGRGRISRTVSTDQEARSSPSQNLEVKVNKEETEIQTKPISESTTPVPDSTEGPESRPEHTQEVPNDSRDKSKETDSKHDRDSCRLVSCEFCPRKFKLAIALRRHLHSHKRRTSTNGNGNTSSSNSEQQAEDAPAASPNSIGQSNLEENSINQHVAGNRKRSASVPCSEYNHGLDTQRPSSSTHFHCKCGKTFDSNDFLERHIEFTKIPEFGCTLCEERFHSLPELEDHFHSSHRNSSGHELEDTSVILHYVSQSTPLTTLPISDANDDSSSTISPPSKSVDIKFSTPEQSKNIASLESHSTPTECQLEADKISEHSSLADTSFHNNNEINANAVERSALWTIKDFNNRDNFSYISSRADCIIPCRAGTTEYAFRFCFDVFTCKSEIDTNNGATTNKEHTIHKQVEEETWLSLLVDAEVDREIKMKVRVDRLNNEKHLSHQLVKMLALQFHTGKNSRIIKKKFIKLKRNLCQESSNDKLSTRVKENSSGEKDLSLKIMCNFVL